MTDHPDDRITRQEAEADMRDDPTYIAVIKFRGLPHDHGAEGALEHAIETEVGGLLSRYDIDDDGHHAEFEIHRAGPVEEHVAHLLQRAIGNVDELRAGRDHNEAVIKRLRAERDEARSDSHRNYIEAVRTRDGIHTLRIQIADLKKRIAGLE